MTSGLAYVSTLFRNTIWFSLIANGIAHGGAAFIKWGQWSSTRPDMFPEELCVVLSHLHSKAPQHSYSFTQNQIKKEFGDIDNIFDSFDKKPIASGSIAQIYKARLNGQDVAVKVRHPNVDEQIRLDFTIMKSIASFIESFPGLSWINLSESLSQFSHTIAAQTDLSLEGKHLYLFNKNFQNWKTVHFPKPIVLSESVLIETFEYGWTVSEYTDLFNSNKASANWFGKIYHALIGPRVDEVEEGDLITVDYDQSLRDKRSNSNVNADLAFFIVKTGEDLYLKMLLADNLMHADLHPGNIFVQQRDGEHSLISPSRSLKWENIVLPVTNNIVLVDAGMVANLQTDEQENFIGLLESIGRGRGDEAADLIIHFSTRHTSYSAGQKQAFKIDMVKLFKKMCRGYGTNVDLGESLRGILHLVRLHKITIEANYATLVMNALCLDALAASLLPSFNVVDGAKPLLEFHRFVKKLGGSKWFRYFIPLAQFVKSIQDSVYEFKLMRAMARKRADEFAIKKISER